MIFAFSLSREVQYDYQPASGEECLACVNGRWWRVLYAGADVGATAGTAYLAALEPGMMQGVVSGFREIELS